jgi:predicted Zn-dependent protease
MAKEVRKIFNREKREFKADIKPIYIMNQNGVLDLEKKAVIDGISELISLTGVGDKLNIYDFGIWRMPNYKNKDGSLNEYQSIDWYIDDAKKQSRNNYQINSVPIIRNFCDEPWRKKELGYKDHYDLFILKDDIYCQDTNFVIGQAAGNFGVVLSTNRFKNLDDKLKYECLKTLAIHEMGHAFGLIRKRTKDIDYTLGPHCKYTCVMRQGLIIPKDWINITNDRLKYGALCYDCKEELKSNF